MSISKLNLPAEFWDKTSARLLLPPEPEYIWARALFASAQAAELKMGEGTPFGPTSERKLPQTGDAVADNVGDVVQSFYSRDFMLGEAMVVEDFTAQPGQTVKMNRVVYQDTTYTTASRRVTRGVVATTGQDITQEQVSITIERYMGPYNSVTSAVGPRYVEEFDARRYPVHQLAGLVSNDLRRDRFKFVDSVVGTIFCTGAATTGYVYPGDPNFALTTDNSAFNTQGDKTLELETMLRAEQRARDNKIPRFSNGRWKAVLSSKQAKDLLTSPAWQRAVAFHVEKSGAFEGQIGALPETDVFVSQTNPTATANSTITVQLGCLFGPGVMGFALAMPVEVREDDNTNFKQRVGVVWVADEGYEVLDNRFLISLRSD